MSMSCFTVPLSVDALDYALGEFDAEHYRLIVSIEDQERARHLVMCGLAQKVELEVQPSMPSGMWEVCDG